MDRVSRVIGRRSDDRIPVIWRCVVLGNFLGLEKETDRGEHWTNSALTVQTSLKRFI